MTRLLIDGTALSTKPKGVGRYSYRLIDQLLQRLRGDWSICVIVFDGDLPQFGHASNLSIIRLPRLSELVKGLAVIPLLTLQTRADVVLMPMEAIALAMGRPKVSVLHDIDALIVSASGYRASTPARVLNRIKQYFRIRTLQNAEAVVCNSAFTAQAAVSRYGLEQNRILVGYCGVDDRFYTADDSHVRDWCEPARYWKGYVLTFATGDPRERYDLCPAIWQYVHGELPEIGLIIAGIRREGAYVAELKKEFSARGLAEVRDYALVDFIGENEFGKLRSLYRDAVFYLELSGHEGFGMQLAEAMATGTTCISSGRGALSEVGDIYAVNFNELEPRQIAEKIIQAYREQLHLRENNAQVAYTRRFSWDSVGALIAGKLAEFQKDAIERS
jgi:glycosyltransferase involved in cell wall biosynthesis